MNERNRLLNKLSQVDFAIVELHLYLDSHPNDIATSAKLDEYIQISKKLREKYESKFGPIKSNNIDSNRWAWISNPWPWDNDEEEM